MGFYPILPSNRNPNPNPIAPPSLFCSCHPNCISTIHCTHYTVPPTFVESPSDTVTDSNSATLNCTVQGYPHPTITWYHDGQSTSNPNKYRMVQTVSGGAPFIVESTLTILDLSSLDSGNVTCVAMVTTDGGESYVEQRTSHLSVLGM